MLVCELRIVFNCALQNTSSKPARIEYDIMKIKPSPILIISCIVVVLCSVSGFLYAYSAASSPDYNALWYGVLDLFKMKTEVYAVEPIKKGTRFIPGQLRERIIPLSKLASDTLCYKCLALGRVAAEEIRPGQVVKQTDIEPIHCYGTMGNDYAE